MRAHNLVLEMCCRYQKVAAAVIDASAATGAVKAAATPAAAVAATPALQWLPQMQQQWCRRITSSTSTSTSQPVDEDIPGKADSFYWIPPEQPFTLDTREAAVRRANGKLESAFESVLLSQGYAREQLIDSCGFSLHRVRYAKDRRTVYVLWDARPDRREACQRALERNAFRLKADLARVLRSKYTPNLEFRHDHLPPMQAAAAQAFEAVEWELTAQAAAASAAAAAARAPPAQDDIGAESLGSSRTNRQHTGPEFDSGSADGTSISEGGYAQQDIEAAIQRLEAATKKRPPGY